MQTRYSSDCDKNAWKQIMIAVTMGDGDGVGPEIILNAWCEREMDGEFVVVGDYSVLDYCSRKLDYPVKFHIVSDPSQYQEGYLNVLDMGMVSEGDLTPGKVNAKVAAASRAYVVKATELALEGKAGAVCTLPVNKEAIRLTDPDFTGHTELIAGICGQDSYTMMLASDKLTVTHVSTHVSMEQSIRNVKKDRVYDVIRLTYENIKRFKAEPYIAVAGLNAHAGEGGAFGRQELDEIIPAVELANQNGMKTAGPIPPDTVFLRASRGEFDAVVCMYHDQGHIPMKLLDFDGGVNVSLGLKVIRASVDHGTAYDIAYQKKASTGSFVKAFEYTMKLMKNE
ncbi:4-hydroxythreonine-4-phosphate dehydrogenase PdxA [Anaerolentibacter hominis]|uniref:4-hydroxythreonine-4-phosphate dehydrogenase PdxA n=1 Tax=Anaerolentibacter hominis TaxID=3079009 RepID=UPI0031B7F284